MPGPYPTRRFLLGRRGCWCEGTDKEEPVNQAYYQFFEKLILPATDSVELVNSFTY
uniref:Uncharacterized protein n=1 Tax=Utricularia reniformis TaxID=192314 RepID=A0A1Y0B265_9LAMI|nr:hypothetical protein AEK19_MT1338 [Utricularia reniformis]ART31536.1 hypothetical protein AEK19_MT1338 [Utricularia reniformis]